MEILSKEVCIYINNIPNITIFYKNGTELESPYNLDKQTMYFANYIAKKCVTNEGIRGILVSKNKDDRFDINLLDDNDYWIAGSNFSKEDAIAVINSIICSCSCKEINAPVYLTDGINKILVNERELNEQKDNYFEPNIETENYIKKLVYRN